MSCFQNQIKNFPWTPDRVAALFRDVRDNFFAKGITDMSDVVKGLSAKYGLRPEIIVKGLSRPESGVRRMTDEMWLNAQRQRKLEMQARGIVPQMENPEWKQNAAKLINFPRSVTLFGHFAAFTKSHLSDQAFYNPSEYAKNFRQSWALISKGGRAAHEQRLTTAFSEADPDYVAMKRAGLDMGQGKFAREISEVTGSPTKTKKVGLAFEELQMTRFRIAKKELANLSPEERSDPEQLKALATVLNHDTGATARSNSVFRFMFLSPRLFPAQLAHTFADIPRALVETGMGARWKTASPAARYVARKTAILVGAQTAMLAASQGVYLATGDDRFKPNLTQFKSDLFRPRIFGYSIPTSPTIELAKLPLMMVAAGIAARKGENRTLEMLRPALETALGRQNPIFTLLEEAITGQSPGSNRPTPFPGLIGTAQPTKGRPTQGVVEYLGTKMPIPFANYLREFDDELQSQGMDTATRESILKTLAVGTVELGTSYHLSPTRPSAHPVEVSDLPGARQMLGRVPYSPQSGRSGPGGPGAPRH